MLAICELTAPKCTAAVALHTDGGDLGTPVEAGGRLFVPDYATGQVWVVDLKLSRVMAQPRVLEPKVRYQLLTRDGVVFFNDPDSERAGVIRLDGGVRPVDKYDPKHPDKGLSPQVPDTPNTPSPGGTPPDSPPPSGPARPEPATSPAPGGPPGGSSEIQISVSKPTVQVDEALTLRVVAVTGPAPTVARWSFDDGTGADGPTTTHRWSEPRAYRVSVHATLATGGSADATAVILVVVGPPPTGSVTVALTGAGTGVVASRPAGIACPPTCTATFPVGVAATLTATPTPTAQFGGWTGECIGTATSCSFTVSTSGVRVGADFAVAGPAVQCGDTITADATLRASLACTGDGVIVGAGVTFDLGGFTLSGAGGGTGVTVQADGATIRNGKITGFGTGISTGGGTGRNLAVINITNTGNDKGFAARLPSVGALTIQGGSLSGSAAAVLCACGPLSISGSALSGLLSFTASRNITLTGNTMNGATLTFAQTNTVLVANNPTMTNTATSVANESGFVFRNNRVQGADVAVQIGGNSTGLQISNNTFSGNRIGVLADQFIPEDLVISGNTFNNNRAAGIYLQAGIRSSTRAQITANTFTGNGRSSAGLTDAAGRSVNDGLHLNLPSGEPIVVSGNTARNNADLGIESINPISDDGTPNHASGNGNPAQCTGLTCQP
jgi:parallel beta-helix repeat protein